MRLKKLMASLLSLSFTAALLPGATLAVNAATLPDNTYLFYEDFENVAGSTGFEILSSAHQASEYKTEELEDNETNSYIQYNKKSDTTMVGGAWYNIDLSSKLGMIDKNGGIYEIGFRVKYNQSTQDGDLFSFRIGAKDWLTPFSVRHKPSSSTNLKITGLADIKPNHIMNDSWMEITTQFSFDSVNCLIGKTTVVYTDIDGEEVTETGTYTAGDTANWNANFFNITIQASMEVTTTSSKIPWGLDDIYFKKLPAKDITFYDGETLVDTKKATSLGKLLEVPILEDVTPTFETPGKDFTGWYEDDDCTIEFVNENITESKPVYAGWVPRYYVKYNECGGTDVDDASTINGTVALPAVTRENYRFDGWFTHETERGEEYIFTGENITQNTQVWAGWTAGERINLDANEGQAYVGGVPVDVTYEVDTISSLPEPIRKGYTFKGWFTDEELTEAVVYGETPVIPDMTVYAAWEIDWVVTLELNGGTVPDDADYVEEDEHGNKVIYVSKDVGSTPLPTMAKVGSNFVAWCTDETLEDVFDGTTVNDDITIYASYNNILFYEDFDDEDNDSLDWLRNLTGNKYDMYKDDYGVVEDTIFSDEGNKSFRVASNRTSLIVPISNGGSGIYEFSMKVRQDGPSSGYMTPNYLGSFMQGNTIVGTGNVTFNTPKFGINDGANILNMFTTATTDWIYITYRYDTVTGLGAQIIKYLASGSTAYTTKKHFNIQHKKSDYVDNMLIFSVGEQNLGTNFYLDEISLIKIESPTAQFKIDGTIDDDGVATNAALTPEIKINFSKLMDEETLNSSTIIVKDSEGVALEPTDYRINTQVVNEKTVATVNIIKTLENTALYTVTVTTEAGTPDEFYVSEDIVYTFKTVPKELELIVNEIKTTTDGRNYTDVTSLVGLRNLTVGISVRNFSGGNGTDGNGRKVFVGAAVVNSTTGRQHAYTFGEATIQEGETQAVISNGRLSGWVTTTANPLTADDELHIFVWDGKDTRNPLIQVYKFTD